jgi:hypothetical protein
MPTQNENKNQHMLQDESIAALGISLGAAIGILVDNMVLGLCCAAGLFLAARAYTYTRLKIRSRQQK